MSDTLNREDLSNEIKLLMQKLSPETDGLLMVQYDVDEPEGVFHYYEVLALDGVHIEYWTDKADIPEEEEELLAAVLDGDFETWESMDDDVLVEYRDFLKSEPPE